MYGIYLYIYIYMCVCVCVCIYIYVCVYIYICVCVCIYIYIYIYILWRNFPLRAYAVSFFGFVDHKQLDTHKYTRYNSSERVISSSHRPLPTQQTQEINIYTLSGIRTQNPSNRSATDLRLRPHDHRNRSLIIQRT